MHSDYPGPQLEAVVSPPILDDDLLHTSGPDSYDDVFFHQSPVRLVPSEVLETWELDQASWRETLEAVVELTMGQGESLFYLPPEEGVKSVIEDEIADENDLPIEDAFKLPVSFAPLLLFFQLNSYSFWLVLDRSVNTSCHCFDVVPVLSGECPFGSVSHVWYRWPRDRKVRVPCKWNRFAQTSGVTGLVLFRSHSFNSSCFMSFQFHPVSFPHGIPNS